MTVLPTAGRVRGRAVSLVLALLLAVGLLAVPTATADAATCDRAPDLQPGFTPLWDGAGDPRSQGWRQSGPGGFDVVDDGPGEGCRLRSTGGLGLLWYADASFADYELRMQWRTEDATDNSGIFVGFPSAGGNTHNLAISSGYEVQVREGTIGDGEDQKTGSIYNEQRELRRAANPAGQWNDYAITVERNEALDRPTITVELNGEVVNVFQGTEDFRATDAGHIGLQNHGVDDDVSFRDIGIRMLSDAQPPTTTHTLSSTGEQLPSGWWTAPVEVALDASDEFGGSGLARTEYRLDGGEWTTHGTPEEVIFDGTRETFDRWRQAPSGSFQLMPDGTMHTVGGLGMLWYPVEYGDMVLRFQFRDMRPAPTGGSNSGVFVRFPDPDEAVSRAPEDRHACQTGSAETSPAWVAISCGHEIQVYDGTGIFDFEPQKTGSIYNFSPLSLEQANPGTQGEWQDYEIRVEGGGDWTATIVRNGQVLQTWTNSPGQEAARAGDPSTDVRQFARGHIGLQNHGYPDHMQFRNVRVQRLEPAEPLLIDEPGRHTLEYRSVDGAGNVEDSTTLRIDIDPAAPVTTATVDQPGGSGPATITLQPTDVGAGVARTEYRIDEGAWTDYSGPTETLLGTSQASFDEWVQAGPGSFERQPDGSIVSRGGLGMLWHPRSFGDVHLTYEWRDLRTDGGQSNSGLFVRFPNPDEAAAAGDLHACQRGGETRPEWVAIYCGQELQMYDGATGETQKTGSVYNFAPLDLQQARAVPTGTWSTYEVELTGGGDWTATISRDGEVINTFTNTPGQQSSRSGDPGTDLRQFAEGHIGLQNHGSSDLVQIRNVRVTDLSPEAAAFVIDTPGTHTVEFRSIDHAGRVEAITVLTVTV